MLSRTSCFALVMALTELACGGSPSAPTPVGFRIAPPNGGQVEGVPGDALRLNVVQEMSDGSVEAVGSDVRVDWSGPPVIQALPIGSHPAQSLLPPPNASPTAIWIQNPEHYPTEFLAGVLWVIDPGQGTGAVNVKASVTSGAAMPTELALDIPIGAAPSGDPERGALVYGSNCASCHGAHGEGGDSPALNADHLLADPAWTQALMTMATRSGMDRMGVSLALDMPHWVTRLSANGTLLTTQDFADIYSFLRTEHDP
jgi:mono/diheme cytochrome c family protein